MRKMNFVPQAKKTAKKAVACALSLAMMVPSTAVFSAATSVEAAEEDAVTPIMTIDMERGIKGEGEKAAEGASEADQAKQQGNGNNMSVVASNQILQFAAEEDSTDPKQPIYKYSATPSFSGEGTTAKYDRSFLANQATTVDDEEKGNVLMLGDTIEVDEYTKTEDSGNATLDSTYPVGTVLQEEYVNYSEVAIKNPFAGLDLSETPDYTEDGEPIWYNGVTITYWVKVPTTTDEEGNTVGKNSTLFTFENTSLHGYQKDDLAKYNKIQEMEAENAEIGGDYNFPADSDFYIGDPVTYISLTDPNTTYTVYNNTGKSAIYNPKYVQGYKVGSGNIYAYPEGGSASDYVTLTQMPASKYDLYCELPTEAQPSASNGLSQIRHGNISGFFEILADNSMVFKEDDGTALQLNPNHTQTYNQSYYLLENGKPAVGENGSLTIQQGAAAFQMRNAAGVYGDGRVLEVDEAGETSWHQVAIVIQNSGFLAYVDGEEIDPYSEWTIWGDELPFDPAQAGNESFNGGFGWDNAKGVSNTLDGGDGNGNTTGRYVLDWLTDENTTLSIGGQVMTQLMNDYVSPCGTSQVMLDDIKFYDTPLDWETIGNLYDEESAAMDQDDTTLPEALKIDQLSSLDGTTFPESNEGRRNQVADPSIVNDATMGNVVKLAASSATETSALQLAENPFAGRDDMTGATISYWLKQDAAEDGTVANSAAVSFVDTAKLIYQSKMQETAKTIKAYSILYSMSNGMAVFQEGTSDAAVISTLKNDFTFSASEEQSAAILAANTEWHYVTMTMANSGIQTYIDGVKIENANDNVGPRFYDGYYQWKIDNDSVATYEGLPSFANVTNNLIYGGTQNQGATSIMSFLTAEDTSVYLGYVNRAGSKSNYQTTTDSYVTCLRFYDEELSDAQVQALYEDAKANDPHVNPTVRGDVNQDGAATAEDALLVLQHAAQLTTLDETQLAIADLNGDGNVTADDALTILRIAAQLD
ncbi:MAG: dockerin type I repeat-containing protein [Lachnospiraceae bacterium]